MAVLMVVAALPFWAIWNTFMGPGEPPVEGDFGAAAGVAAYGTEVVAVVEVRGVDRFVAGPTVARVTMLEVLGTHPDATDVPAVGEGFELELKHLFALRRFDEYVVSMETTQYGDTRWTAAYAIDADDNEPALGYGGDREEVALSRLLEAAGTDDVGAAVLAWNRERWALQAWRANSDSSSAHRAVERPPTPLNDAVLDRR